MIYKILIFFIIFLVGEIIMNYTFFRYLKHYFSVPDNVDSQENKTDKKFLGFNISVFKGLLERFIIYLCLVKGILPILIVFGALKLGTRINNPNEKIKNDYFLIGNLSSILIAVIYYHLFTEINLYLKAV